MVSAEASDSGLGVSEKEGIPQSSIGSSIKNLTDANLPNESLGRLSISGRLSLGQPPATPLVRNRDSISNLLSAPTSTMHIEENRRDSTVPSTAGRSEFIRDRFAGMDRTTPLMAPVEPKDTSININAGVSKLGATSLRQPPEISRNVHTNVNPSLTSPGMAASSTTNGTTIPNTGNIPQLIKGLVESSIADAMAEIRNDIQNLHVELIKQSLAQQNALHQIVANMPDMYKRLSDEYRVLQEENERLKLRLGLEK